MPTIFYTLFNAGKSRHDRLQFFDGPKTLQEFFTWHIERRNEIEKIVNEAALVENMAFIEQVNPMPQKHYGFYQLCPKCDGWGEVQLPETSKPMFGTCPVCNGAKLIPRPEIKEQ